MALAETARLVSSLELNTTKFDSGIRKATGSLGKLSGSVARSRAVAVGLGIGLERVAEKGISSLAGAIGDGIASAQELEKAQAQTQAVITSTGAKAGVTAKQVRDLANAQEDLTTVDDRVVQQGENLLLTFTNIGANVFPRATAAITNMAVALNKGDAATADLHSSAIQVGKALNDPIKGITALQKVGVSFTADQKKQISGNFELTKQEAKHYAALLKTNKAAAAQFKAQHDANAVVKGQLIILAELDKEFGKAGAAAGTGFTADVLRARDAIEDAQVAIAQGLIPAVGEVAKELSTTLRDPQVIQGLKDLGTGIGDVIKGGVEFAKTVPWATIADSLRTAAGFAKDLLNAFLGLPTWVQTAVITGWGLNKITGGLITDLASGLIKGVLGINAGVVNVNAASVAGGGIGGAAGAAGKGIGVLGKVALIGETVGLVAAVEQVWQAVNDQSSQQATDINTQTQALITSQPKLQDLQTALAGVDQGISDLQSNPLNVLVQGSALDQLKAMHGDLVRAIKDFKVIPLAPKTKAQAAAILSTGAAHDKETSSSIKALVDGVKQGVGPDIESLRGKIGDGLSGVRSATQSGSASIVSAIHGIGQPLVTVNVSGTSVTRRHTIVKRGGPTSGTRQGSARQNEPFG